MDRELLYKLSMGVILVASLVVIYIGYLLFFPINAIEVKKSPLTIVNKRVHPGDKLYLLVEYCKKVDFPHSMTVELSGDTILPILGSPKYFPTGCHIGKNAYKASVVIPLSTTEGRYRLWIIKNYKVNSIRNITYQLESEEFEVIK